MWISLGIINTAHVSRYWLGIARGETESHGVRVILVDERRILLVSHWYAPWAWTLPGGGVNKGETVEQAAIREIKEEVGFDVNTIAGEIGTYRGTMGEKDKVTVVYTGDFSGSMNLHPNLEIMARSWFDIDALPEEISPANYRRIQAYKDGVRNESAEW